MLYAHARLRVKNHHRGFLFVQQKRRQPCKNDEPARINTTRKSVFHDKVPFVSCGPTALFSYYIISRVWYAAMFMHQRRNMLIPLVQR